MNISPFVDPWLRMARPNPNVRLRLLCFPYAGGAASIYRLWPQYLPAQIEVCAVQLPGREERMVEAPFTNLVELVQTIVPALLPYLDKPFALFGHSMGSLIAYELAQELESRGYTPAHLMVSGRRAPGLPEAEPPVHNVPGDLAFLSELQRRYNNVPALIFSEPELRDLVVPLLRADLELVETYQYRAREPLLCPVAAFGGAADRRVTTEALQAWNSVTRGPFAVLVFHGGHFYLNEQMEPLLAAVASHLA